MLHDSFFFLLLPTLSFSCIGVVANAFEVVPVRVRVHVRVDDVDRIRVRVRARDEDIEKVRARRPMTSFVI